MDWMIKEIPGDTDLGSTSLLRNQTLQQIMKHHTERGQTCLKGDHYTHTVQQPLSF